MLANPFSLDGKVALVTGANSGLGREVALALRDAGALVAIGGRRTDRNARVLELLGNSAAAFQLDVSNEGSVERAVSGAELALVRIRAAKGQRDHGAAGRGHR